MANCLDNLTYAGNRENLRDLESNPRYHFYQGDIVSAQDVRAAAELLPGGPDALVNFAAKSHVDHSIRNPGIFVRTNVQGTLNLLTYAQERHICYLQVSTDEVYGSLGPTGLSTEDTPLAPNRPYSASKAGADLLVRAWPITEPLLSRRDLNNPSFEEYKRLL